MLVSFPGQRLPLWNVGLTLEEEVERCVLISNYRWVSHCKLNLLNFHFQSIWPFLWTFKRFTIIQLLKRNFSISQPLDESSFIFSRKELSSNWSQEGSCIQHRYLKTGGEKAAKNTVLWLQVLLCGMQQTSVCTFTKMPSIGKHSVDI